jgi:hypothetical protein
MTSYCSLVGINDYTGENFEYLSCLNDHLLYTWKLGLTSLKKKNESIDLGNVV